MTLFDNETYHLENTTVEKQISKVNGYFKQFDEETSFNYSEAGKLVEIIVQVNKI